ncbi:uncharacterized protein [Aegilops tauschii subsp. strangulata]|uniref:uncharacterized protein n=1 Tax=Aegilops tauschii subsp. strangulata TaxID=200361 RepID=UPI00098B38AA
MALEDSSSSEEEEEDDDDFDTVLGMIFNDDVRRPRRASQFGRKYINRDRAEDHAKIMRDYFGPNPTYPKKYFHRCFRMHTSLFLTIAKPVERYDDWFKLQRNASGEITTSPLMKCIADVRVLAYGCSADAIDDYVRIGEDTISEAIRRFTKAVIAVFGPKYLRTPIEEDTQRLMTDSEARGWPGMLGSLDCMHWRWKNCPVSWKV